MGDALCVLKTRVPGRTLIVAVASLAETRGVFVMDAETRRGAWGGRVPRAVPFDRKRGEELVGARLLALGESHVTLLLAGGGALRLEARPSKIVAVRGAQGERPELLFASADEATRQSWLAMGASVARRIGQIGLGLRKEALGRAFTRAEGRLERRLSAIRGDLGRIAEAEATAQQATWLIAAAARAPRGARSLEVTDWSTGEPRPLVVPLDPAKPAKDQVEAIFRRAKRLKLGRVVAEARLAATEDALLALLVAREALAKAPDLAEVERLAEQARRASPRDLRLPEAATCQGSAPRARREPSRPYRIFSSEDGTPLLVGKGAAHNDALTLRIARPHDLWLHTKDRVGAHVVVQLGKGRDVPPGVLVDAAHLAAHFSDARDEAIVDVQYTPRKYLRKPKGSSPGFVLVDREKILVLRVDASRTRSLLEREEV